MELFAVLAAGLAGIALWLAGHWFGRVVAFVAIAPVVMFLPGALLALWLDGSGLNAGAPGIAIGLVAGWIVSGIPRAIQRTRIQRTMGEVAPDQRIRNLLAF